jgi:hypothetical protein
LKTTDYLEIIRGVLGERVARIARVIISLGYCVSQVFGVVYFLDFFKNSMRSLGLQEVLAFFSPAKQFLFIFAILLPLYLHRRVANMNLLFFGIITCFMSIVLFLSMKSIYIILTDGVAQETKANLLPKDLRRSLLEIPTFSNLLFFQDACVSMFSNSKREDLGYKLSLLKNAILTFTGIAFFFGILCYSAGFGEDEDWIFEVRIETNILRVLYYSLACCLGFCFLLYGSFASQVFFQVNFPRISLSRKRVFSTIMLGLVLLLAHLLGDLQHFFNLNALFNEFLLGHLMPLCMMIKDTRTKEERFFWGSLVLLTVFVHGSAIHFLFSREKSN